MRTTIMFILIAIGGGSLGIAANNLGASVWVCVAAGFTFGAGMAYVRWGRK